VRSSKTQKLARAKIHSRVQLTANPCWILADTEARAEFLGEEANEYSVTPFSSHSFFVLRLALLRSRFGGHDSGSFRNWSIANL
jgi:hypothetical protein